MATGEFELQNSCIRSCYANTNIVQLALVAIKIIFQAFRILEQSYTWLNIYKLSGCGSVSRFSHLKQQSSLWL